MLNPNCCFMLIDVFREEEETHDCYLAKYKQNIRKNWFSLTKDEIDMAITYIENCDFPETENTIINQVKKPGFSKYEFIY